MSSTEVIVITSHGPPTATPLPQPPTATRLKATFKYIRHPPTYCIAAMVTATAGLLFGMDTGIIGPITTMPQFSTSMGGISPSLHGLIVSTILIPAAAISFFAGHLADKVGRTKAIAIGTGIFGVGAALEAASVHLAMLIVGRVVTGLGEGLFLSTLVVYICEISPPKERGALASIPQLLITVGICAGYFICYGTVRLQSSVAWRLPFALQSGIALAIAVSSMLFLPQSPRWLAMSGRKEEATRMWDMLGVLQAEREKMEELEQVTSVDEQNRAANRGAEKNSGLLKAFGRNVWKRTALSCFLMGFQQAAGIDGILYYSALLFQQAGLSTSKSSFLASGVSALLMVAVTIPATSLSDKWGRRTSTVLGGILMAFCMLLIGSLYAANLVQPHSGASRWVIIVAIYVFVVVFSITWAVGIKLFASEIQPQETRAAGTSLAYSANWIVNWVVAFTTPIFLASSSSGAYFLFGGCIVLTVIVCIVFMPETRGISLENTNDGTLSIRPGSGNARWLRRFTRGQDNVSSVVEMTPHPYRTLEDALVL